MADDPLCALPGMDDSPRAPSRIQAPPRRSEGSGKKHPQFRRLARPTDRGRVCDGAFGCEDELEEEGVLSSNVSVRCAPENDVTCELPDNRSSDEASSRLTGRDTFAGPRFTNERKSYLDRATFERTSFKRISNSILSSASPQFEQPPQRQLLPGGSFQAWSSDERVSSSDITLRMFGDAENDFLTVPQQVVVPRRSGVRTPRAPDISLPALSRPPSSAARALPEVEGAAVLGCPDISRSWQGAKPVVAGTSSLYRSLQTHGALPGNDRKDLPDDFSISGGAGRPSQASSAVALDALPGSAPGALRPPRNLRNLPLKPPGSAPTGRPRGRGDILNR